MGSFTIRPEAQHVLTPVPVHTGMSTKVTTEINRFYDACCLFEPLHESPASLLPLSWEAGPASGVADRRLRPESKKQINGPVCVCMCGWVGRWVGVCVFSMCMHVLLTTPEHLTEQTCLCKQHISLVAISVNRPVTSSHHPLFQNVTFKLCKQM